MMLLGTLLYRIHIAVQPKMMEAIRAPIGLYQSILNQATVKERLQSIYIQVESTLNSTIHGYAFKIRAGFSIMGTGI